MKIKIAEITLLFILGFFVTGCLPTIPDPEALAPDQPSSEVNQEKTEVPKDWVKFRNEALGIEFYYPSQWGQAYTEPIMNITSLQKAKETPQFTGQDNAYFGKLEIDFSRKDGFRPQKASIDIFGQEYQGEKYPNSFAYQFGYMDNIPELKNSENICDYKIDFNVKQYKGGSMREVWSECRDNVKVALTQKIQHFGGKTGTLHTYRLTAMGYKKLKNGVFNNAMLFYDFARSAQVKDGQVNNLEEYFEIVKEEQTAAEYIADLEDFKKFLGSFNSFTPLEKKRIPFEEQIGKDQAINTIRKYYYLLENADLKAAYDMKVNNVSFEEFKGFYENIFMARPYDFEKLDQGKYEFFIDYQDHNKPKEKYRVIMQVGGDNKITTLLTERYLVEEVAFGDIKAYAANRNNANRVFLIKNGKEIEVDKAGDCYKFDDGEADCSWDIGETAFYSSIEFSPKGNYLIYTGFVWEAIIVKVYDIKNGKIMKLGQREAVVTDKLTLTPDEKYAFYCTEPGMHEGAAKVFSVPGFSQVLDAFKEEEVKEVLRKMDPSVHCAYDEKNNEISFRFTTSKAGSGGERDNESKIIRFSVTEGKVVE